MAPYDPFRHGEQVYLGSMDLELSFTKANFKTDHQLDSDELAKFFSSVLPPPHLTDPRCSNPKYLPQVKSSQWTIDPFK